MASCGTLLNPSSSARSAGSLRSDAAGAAFLTALKEGKATERKCRATWNSLTCQTNIGWYFE